MVITTFCAKTGGDKFFLGFNLAWNRFLTCFHHMHVAGSEHGESSDQTPDELSRLTPNLSAATTVIIGVEFPR